MNAKLSSGSEPGIAAVRAEIIRALGGLQYGQLVIMIKDGQVTQIDRTEKRRVTRLPGTGGEGV